MMPGKRFQRSAPVHGISETFNIQTREIKQRSLEAGGVMLIFLIRLFSKRIDFILAFGMSLRGFLDSLL